jgi:uncharacterized membrane protein
VTALTVWRYDTAFGADAGEVRLKALEERGRVVVHDAALISWLPGATTPRVRAVRHRTAGAASKGGIVGGLLGTLVLAPAAGAAAGAAVGALAQKLRGSGIESGFLEEVQQALGPGTSALVLLTSDADPDAVRQWAARGDCQLIQADLDPEAAARLAALDWPDTGDVTSALDPYLQSQDQPPGGPDERGTS